MVDKSQTRDSHGAGNTNVNDAAFGRGGFGDGSYSGAGVGRDAVLGNIAKATGMTPAAIKAILSGTMKGVSVGKNAGIPGAIIGAIVGGYGSFTAQQKEAAEKAVMDAYGVTQEVAKDIIGQLKDGFSSGKLNAHSTAGEINASRTDREPTDPLQTGTGQPTTPTTPGQDDDDNDDAGEDTPGSTTQSGGDFWNAYKDEFFRDENNVRGLLEEGADFKKTEAEKFNESITGATDRSNNILATLGNEARDDTTVAGANTKYQGIVDALADEAKNDNTVSNANDKYQAMLDQLTGEANYNTGRFKPIMYTAGGNTISKVPNSALKEIAMVQGLGREGFDASGLTAQQAANLRDERSVLGQGGFNASNITAGQAANLRKERGSYGQGELDNTSAAAKSIYDTADARSPAAARLAYLNALQGNIDTEEGMRRYDQTLAEDKRQFDEDLVYRKDALAKGYDTNSRRLDQSEPGLWSYLGLGSQVLGDVADIDWSSLFG